MAQDTRYELLDRIAIGGMAELFRARIRGEEGFYKIVAVKRILPQYSANPEFVHMLVDEARTASNLSHPNIAEVYELRRDSEGGLFIAMEFVLGTSLANLLKKLSEAKRSLPEPCAIDVAIHLLEALDYAHRMTDPTGRPLHIVHRDVSPENILISREGAVKLTDFGVAKARGRVTETERGTVKGKLAYMSPEQVYGNAVDGRSDIFAAALVFWEAMANRKHYDATSDFELMKQVAEGRARPLAEVGVKTAAVVEQALQTALAYRPEDRHQRAGDFARDLAIHHRATYPSYSPAGLGALVEELFGGRFAQLAERLQMYDTGKIHPFGTLGPATSGEAVVATKIVQVKPAGEPTTDPQREPLCPPSRAAVPAVRSDRPAPGLAEEQPGSAETVRPVDSAKSPRGARGIVIALLVIAACAGIGAMAWLRGEKLVAEPPQAPTPLARPDPPPAPEPEVRADRVEPEARVDRARTEPKPKKGLPKRPKVVTPTEGGMGQLELTCVPGTCEIEIDGMATGVAPLKSLTLAPGTHRVHATNRQVNLYKVSTVEIVAGQTTKKNVNLVTDL